MSKCSNCGHGISKIGNDWLHRKKDTFCNYKQKTSKYVGYNICNCTTPELATKPLKYKKPFLLNPSYNQQKNVFEKLKEFAGVN